MAKTSISVASGMLVLEDPSPTQDEIRSQLANILESPSFHGSKRCHQFLEYVCGKALSGEADSLKERIIAIEVFGRQPASDLSDDTIVRVNAREVRKRLAQYYVTPEGVAAPVRIDLPTGSYVPEVHYAHVKVEKEEPPPSIVTAPVVVRPIWRSRPRFLILAVASFVLLAAVLTFTVVKLKSVDPNTEVFSKFWGPVLRSRDPLLLAVGHPIVYHPSARASKLNEERLPSPPFLMQRPLQVPPEMLDGSDMIPVLNQYVGFGDMVAGTEVASMLASKSKGVRVRLASSVDFAELLQTQVLLIGAITNRWTMELAQGFRFKFARNADRRSAIIDTLADQRESAPREWSIPPRDDGSAPEDYFLISRLPGSNSPTGNLVIIAAGLKQFGTEAAGRLAADPTQFGPILNKLPAGWETKNLQVVLHTKVIGNAPARPELVASHVW